MENKKEEKIGITAVSSDLNSLVDSRFGRCSYFLIVDEKGKLLDAVSNEGQQARRGAGIAAAQTLVDSGIKTVISGNIGPSAYSVLNSAGVKIFQIDYGITADKAFEKYKKEELKEIKNLAQTGLFPPRQRGEGRRFRGR